MNRDLCSLWVMMGTLVLAGHVRAQPARDELIKEHVYRCVGSGSVYWGLEAYGGGGMSRKY